MKKFTSLTFSDRGRIHPLHPDLAPDRETQRGGGVSMKDAHFRAGIEPEVQWLGRLRNFHLHPQQTFLVFKREGVDRCRRDIGPAQDREAESKGAEKNPHERGLRNWRAKAIFQLIDGVFKFGHGSGWWFLRGAAKMIHQER